MTGFYPVLPGFTPAYLGKPHFNRFYWLVPSTTVIDLDFLGFTEFISIFFAQTGYFFSNSINLTKLELISPGFTNYTVKYLVLPSFPWFYRII